MVALKYLFDDPGTALLPGLANSSQCSPITRYKGKHSQ